MNILDKMLGAYLRWTSMAQVQLVSRYKVGSISADLSSPVFIPPREERLKKLIYVTLLRLMTFVYFPLSLIFSKEKDLI